ncbi:MAG: RHS repeat domain-containing protein [Pyrinomonadaceae bacterium]
MKKVTASETRVFVYNAGGKLVSEYSTLTPNGSPVTRYLTADHLGSPRVLTDQSGSVLSRRDFMPFGEEAMIGTGPRAAGHGYTYGDSTRQKFTSYERDNETDLDFAQARMYGNSHGRFTSPDPILSSSIPTNPQTWNKYIYCLNNPLNNVDPTGMWNWSAALGGSASDDDLRKKISGIQNDQNLTQEQRDAQIADINSILTQRQQFRDALSLLQTIIERGDFSDPERMAASWVLSTYGTENDENGTILAIRTNEDAAAFTREENGKIVIAIAPSQFAKNSLAFTVFHEGRHALQIGIKNIMAKYGQDVNPSVAGAEFDAYYYTASLVKGLDSAFVNANRASSGPGAYSAGQPPTTLWQRGWNEVDMKAGVETHLRTLQLLDSNNKETSRGSQKAFPGGGAGQWK